MATALKNKSHQWQLFLLLIVYVLLLVGCFVAFQYKRERYFKVEQLDGILQVLNTSFADSYKYKANPDSFYESHINFFNGLRLTIINKDGKVIYDSQEDASTMPNHLNRQEIKDAIQKGRSYTTCRISESNHNKYFYSALYSDGLIFRSALPYSHSLSEVMKADRHFIYFISIVFILISTLGYFMTRRLDRIIVREEEAEKTKLRRELTNNINHELKTPVSSILGYIETIQEHPEMDDETKNSFIKKMHKQTIRLTKLLNDVATITRMDAAGERIERSKIMLNDLITEILQDTKLKNKAKGFRLETNIAESLPIIGNSMLLESIFSNLIENAVAYSGGSEVHVDLTEKTKYRLYFSVYDNGVGVEEKHFAHLFDRFYRVDKGRSRKEGGTGLGLSIVKNAVNFHGGEITVRNRPEGGLQFDFSLKI
jgi:Osmosensitive K+ channel histidine kinase